MAQAAILPAHFRSTSSGWIGHAAIFAIGGVLYFLCRYFPAELPVWMPWEFVWPEYLAAALALYWFARGLARMDASERPSLWRQASFVLGVILLYAVLQTRIDYYA